MKRLSLILTALALIIALTGCTGTQDRARALEFATQEPKTCDIHFLNFRGQPFPVLIKRIDGPGHLAFMLMPENPPMTKDQVHRYLEEAEEPEINAHIIKGVPCGKYQIMAPTLGLIAEHEICDCKKSKYNVAFYILPGTGQVAKHSSGASGKRAVSSG